MTADTLADFPPVETDRLRLRILREDDAEALQRITDHPAITGAIHFLSAPFTVSDAQRLIIGRQDGRDCFIGAWRVETGEMAAVIGSHLHGDSEVEIGYWVRASLHGKGFATEAVSAVLSALRRKFPHRQIIAECRTENIASWRLLEKLGFHAAGEAGRRPGRQRLALGWF
jgi:RimJ/RimL family protein N-acetyltransferase